MGEGSTTLVRINKAYIAPIDKAVDNTRDKYGAKKWLSRRDFVDDAVKDLLQTVEVPAE